MSGTHARLETWAWVCLYGGLLVMGLGLATWGQPSAWPLMLVLGGGVVAVLGLLLIVLRARRSDR